MRSSPDPPAVSVCTNADAVAESAANEICRLAEETIASEGRFRVALSGGSTPRRLFGVLATVTSRVDWSRVDFFWGDERCVPADHPDSNYAMAFETLLDPLAIDSGQIFRVEGAEGDPEETARMYEGVVRSGVKGTHSFDLVLLGLGDDGHTASLFPDTPALDEQERWVRSNFVPRLDAHRITLTFPALNAARRILFLVCGENKARVTREVFSDPTLDYPAQRVCPDHGDVVWFLDHAAAQELEASPSNIARSPNTVSPPSTVISETGSPS